MRVGDKVRVVAGGGQEDFFDDGCVGILTEASGERGWWVDFNNQENARGTFCPDNGGVWAVSEHNLVLVFDAPTNPEVAQLQARVAELEAALRTVLVGAECHADFSNGVVCPNTGADEGEATASGILRECRAVLERKA